MSSFAVQVAIAGLAAFSSGGDWKKHVVHEGEQTLTAVAADFTGDGKVDVIANSAGLTRLFVGPNWKEQILDRSADYTFIHSEVFDVDSDGDPDFIGARYKPGLIIWYECPDKPIKGVWKQHLISDRLNGVHGILKCDVDGDGKVDLAANSALPVGKFPVSAIWLTVPDRPREAKRWKPHVFADKDAPGLSHYLGSGDVNGDSRLDMALASKGGEQDNGKQGEWFAWWEASADPKKPFKKHLLPGRHPGATNIHPADVNGDGKVDLVASRGHGRGLIWFENPSWRPHDINVDLEFPHCLQVADLDEDGDVDVATCAFGSKIAAWFENDGKGTFVTHVIARKQAAYDMRVIDMDCDGDLDLLIAGQRSKNVVWYENRLKFRKSQLH